MPKKTLNKKLNEKIDPQLRKVTGEIAKAARKPMLFFADLSTDLPATQEADFDMAQELVKFEGSLQELVRAPSVNHKTIKTIGRFLDSRLLREIKDHCVHQLPDMLSPKAQRDLKRLRELCDPRSSSTVYLFGLQWQRSGRHLSYNCGAGELTLIHRSGFELLGEYEYPFSIAVYRNGSVTDLSGPDLQQLLTLAFGLLIDRAKEHLAENRQTLSTLHQHRREMSKSVDWTKSSTPAFKL